jgi:hypothetical protein
MQVTDSKKSHVPPQPWRGESSGTRLESVLTALEPRTVGAFCFLFHGRENGPAGRLEARAISADFLGFLRPSRAVMPFEHVAEALAERHPEGVEFLARRPDPDRQIDAPARNVVEYREVLGDTHRVVQRQQQHVSANADALSARRHRCQERDRRRAPRVGREMVLARPYRVEAELFGQFRLFEEIAVHLVHRLRAARQLANSHADDELHAALPNRGDPSPTW